MMVSMFTPFSICAFFSLSNLHIPKLTEVQNINVAGNEISEFYLRFSHLPSKREVRILLVWRVSSASTICIYFF